MFDSPIIAKDEEEMEDFHDYEDEEHSEMDSKLDEFDDFAFRDIGFGNYVSHIDIFLKLDYG